MTVSAKVIAHSRDIAEGNEILSIQLRYPRFIHSELMTHRVFSRNASSSRAIPVERLIKDILTDTAMPMHWGKNQKGMQAQQEWDAEIGLPYTATDPQGFAVTRNEAYTREEAWEVARDRAVEVARAFDKAGYHKQIVNRILEPFSHINVLVTSTEWDNFFQLRRHPDAQPEIHALADVMWDAIQASVPEELKVGDWHLPYISYEEKRIYDLDRQIASSVARCARVSYMTHEGKTPSVEEDIKLYKMLVGSEPLHASPAEHQATPDKYIRSGYGSYGWVSPEKHRNFRGWIQFRSMLEGG